MKRQNNFSKFHDLRIEFPFFSYDSYQYQFMGNSMEIFFSFNLSGKYFFNPHISIPYKTNLFRPFDDLSAEALNNLVFHIGMIELISYWKAACPPDIIIKPHHLSAAQLKFWKKIYYHGLGEFFYINSIKVDEDDFMNINCPEGNAAIPFRVTSSGNCLVPVGGGKDSAVTMGIFNRNSENWLPFVINLNSTTKEVIFAAGKNVNQIVEFSREIHPQLLELNKAGFLNGHTPFSALLAFYTLLAGYLTGRTDIVLSNESSANEVTIPGTKVNHQYSKSIGFEKDFREYTGNFISNDFNYFSLLRPLSELKIARLFSEMPEFLHSFRSCNVGSKTSTWCGHCPKCLFTFIILSPFIKPETLIEIFGKNLLNDPSLENTFEQLSGKQEIKPFECIGTVTEVNMAMDQAAKMYPDDKLPYLIRVHRQMIPPPANKSVTKPSDLSGGKPDHYVPEKYINLLEKALR